MKKIKKNILGLSLTFAVIIGTLSFISKDVNAGFDPYCEFAAYTYFDNELEMYVTYCPNYVAPNGICFLPCFLIGE